MSKKKNKNCKGNEYCEVFSYIPPIYLIYVYCYEMWRRNTMDFGVVVVIKYSWAYG